MKRNFTLLMAAFALMVSVMMPLGMMGQTTYTFTSKSWAATPANWTSGKDGYRMTSGRGVQVTTSVTGANATSPVSFSDVKQIVVIYSTNASEGAGTIKIQVGNNDEKSFSVTKTGGTADREATFDYSTVESGEVKLTVLCTTNSVYIKSVAIKTRVKAPTFNPTAGTYSTTQNVTLSSATSGATIYYTTDGSSPTTSSSVYTSPIQVSSTTTIKAFAVKSGMTNSTLATATYTIDSGTQYTVGFNAGSGTCGTTTMSGVSGTNITLPTATPSSECANMGWSFVGWATSSVNETNTAPTLLTGNYTINGNATLYAVYRCNSGSATTSETMNFSSGVYNSTYETITWTMSGVMSIKQERNGNSNTAPSSTYVGTPRWYKGNKITITPSTRINSISITANTATFASNLAGSTFTNATAVVDDTNVTITPDIGNNTVTIVMANQCRLSSLSVDYTYNVYSYATSPICMEQVATPTFTPAAGSYSTAQNVTINCSTEDATIYYTTDGTMPTTSSNVYASAITVSETTTIKAIAVKTNMADSEVAIGTFTIVPVLHTTHTPTTPFPYTGGSGSFNFSVTNPVTGATVSAVADNWITPTVSDGVVNFQVSENHGGARSGNITLNYVSNGNTLATTTVSISQEANPDQPGSEANPYSVTQAIENTPSSGTSDFVYVTGIVSKIYEIEVFQYHNARYVITTDGNYSSSADTVMVYRGKYFYGQDFISEDQLQLGDEVVVYGKLTKYHNGSELAADNYIVSLNRAVQPVTFNPNSCVTVSCDVYLFTNSLYEGWDAQIFYTTDGRDPIEHGVLLENPWDESLSVTQTTTIKAAAYIPDLGKWSAVTEATYTIVDPESPGWQNNPYTVSEACEALATHSNIKGAYVQGVVSSITQIETTQYFNATYFIIDEGQATPQLQVYRGKYIARADFVSEDQLLPGDQVVVFGDLAVYNGTKEFKGGNYIVNWNRSTSILVSPSQYEFNSNAISSFNIDVHYSDDILVNVNNPTLQLCDADGNEVPSTTYEWLQVSLSQANDWDLMCDIDANTSDQARTAYLKVLCQDQNGNVIESNLITITQNEYRPDFAELPFEFNGGRAEIEDIDGLTQNNLGEDYSSTTAPTTKLKFESKTENGVVNVSSLVLKINEAPGILSYNIKANSAGGAWSGTFKVQASADGLSWNDMYEYNGSNLNGTVRQDTINNLPPTTRYIQWIYVTKSNGNVGLGNIKLTKAPCAIEIVQPTIDGTQVGTIYTNAQEAVEGVTVGMSINYQPTDYYFVEWVVTDAEGNPVTVDNPTAITAYFTMPATSVTVTATMVIPNTPCTYAYSINGVVGETTTASVGEQIQQMPSSSNIVVNDQTFTFRGWTTDANNVTDLILPGSSFTLRQDVTFYAVYFQQVTGLVAEKHYAKVTRELSDWSGDYLIVYEAGNVAFNGGLETLDAVGNTVPVSMSNGIIIATETLNAAKFTIAAVDGGYSIKSASGKYIGRTGESSGMNENATIQYVNTISYAPSGVIEIEGASGAYLKYNTSSGNNRFRYYMSGQKDIQLYKYVGSVSNLYTRIFMNETANSVTIEGPSIIPNGSVLEVTTITNNVGADRLLVDEGGQLVASNNVNASVRKFITPYQQQQGKDNYYLVASPVNNLNPATAGMTGANFDLYAFDQSAQGEEWQNYKSEAFTALETGKGYLYANDYGGFINMGGAMAATANDVTITEVSGKPFAGWNLIGNPYPCNVTIDKPFYRLAEGGAALATVATDYSVAIAPMEGVFVCADGTETVSFTKAPTTSTTGGRNLLSMRVSRNRSSKDDRVDTDNAIVRFGEGAMLRKLVLNPDLSQLYVAQGGTNYAIVNAEAEGEMPVSFRAAENGSYTISVAAEGVDFSYLHLIDHKTGADVDLLQTPYYTFEAQTGDYTSRFMLVFSVGASSDDEAFAYYNGSQWVVSSEGEATLQVVDVMGRVLSSQTLNGNAEVDIHRAAGVYLLRLINGSNAKVQKIIIK